MCIHLKPLEEYLKSRHIPEIFRGQPWTQNCREWVYYDAILAPEALKERLHMDDSVTIHNYQDARVGSELGLVCNQCHDAIVGLHPQAPYAQGKEVIS